MPETLFYLSASRLNPETRNWFAMIISALGQFETQVENLST